VLYDQAAIIFRVFCALFALVGVFILYFLSHTAAKISEAAHSPYKHLNKMMAKDMIQTNQWQLTAGKSTVQRKLRSFKLKFHILIFIERLAGPTIGIYCYNIFPFTNYEFYQYVISASTLFILLLRIF